MHRMRWASTYILVLACVGVSAGASGADIPGLPPIPPPPPFRQDTAASSSSINEAAPSKQWYRLPAFVSIARTRNTYDQETGQLTYGNDVWIISPKGAPEPFGYLPPFRVNNSAFGAIPSVVTIEAAQLRDPDNYPVPFDLTQTQEQGGSGPANDAVLKGQIDLTVTKLTVDGVPVDLGRGCSPLALRVCDWSVRATTQDLWVRTSPIARSSVCCLAAL